jgi:Arc/MetJ-type ribon-helix-helix transcriptional regulator
MSNKGQYRKHVHLYLTDEMHQFVQLMAERGHTSVNAVIRQAIREHLDVQEDIITSRSRLGRTVMRQLGEMHRQILDQLTYLTKLNLAAVIIGQADRGADVGDISKRIVSLAQQPAMNKLLDKNARVKDKAPK